MTDPQERAKDLVGQVSRYSGPYSKTFERDIRTVWFSKTLQNWKGLFIEIRDGKPTEIYYEVTYNGDKKETYVDVYKKLANHCVPDQEEL